MITLIGLSGKLQSGKDTVAGMIKDIQPDVWEIKRFAGKLKQIVSLLTGIKIEDLENIDVKNSSLGPNWNNLTVREMLQKVGTEAMRDQIHSNIWVNALFADYKALDSQNGQSMGNVIDYSRCKFPSWIITDLRFPNEAEAIQKRGGIVIRVNRKGNENTGNHPSETTLDDFKDWNHVIDNDSDLTALYDKVDALMQPLLYQHLR